ncbi:MAG: Na/Pi cotransporter family protein, partial [Spirochaetales bacterium]|nr:Na/Pi cotransporter family protein [Spirochaetales bacterium]
MADMGLASILIAVAVGTVLTILVHSSSASTAIVITLAVEGVIGFEMAAGLVLGCNIGTTVDAFLSSIGAKTNARRAAWIHILFNVIGSAWVIVLFKPFLALVNLMAGGSTVAQHIAMMHTVFNTINALVFIPFVDKFTGLVSRFVKDRPDEDGQPRKKLEYIAAPLMNSPELNLIRARKEISDMAGLCGRMFGRWRRSLAERPADMAIELESFRDMEEYADQMRDELSRFLLDCAAHDLSAERQRDIGVMLRMVVDLEDITDDCFSLAILCDKAASRKIDIHKSEIQSLVPYTQLVEEFLRFVQDNINANISEEQLRAAGSLEDRIDDFRSALRKKARKRLQTGANVKSELLFMDIVRHVEKIGDHAYGVAHALREIT